MSEDNKTTIRAVVRQLAGQQALVEVESGGCGRCHEKGGCGGQQLTQMLCGGPKTYLADNEPGAQVGETVTVAIESGAVRQTANLVYGLPLTVTIAGALLGMQWGGDLAAMAGAALGLGLAIFYVRLRMKNPLGNLSARPHIISRS